MLPNEDAVVFPVRSQTNLGAFLIRAMGVSRTRLKKMLTNGWIEMNDRPVSREDTALRPGDRVSVLKRRAQKKPAPLYGVKVIYEDDWILVAEKPSGLLTVATDRVSRVTAMYAVNEYLNRTQDGPRRMQSKRRGLSKKAFIVHRLDRDASGLMVFAKDFEVKQRLQDDWQRFTKKYWAVVNGTPPDSSGTLSGYLKEDSTLAVRPAGPEDGKWAVTHYRVLKSKGKYSLLEIRLETGRKHQIRVHLASWGHPIVGDRRYGEGGHGERLELHAFYLGLDHPVTGKRMNFETPPPERFDDYWENQ